MEVFWGCFSLLMVWIFVSGMNLASEKSDKLDALKSQYLTEPLNREVQSGILKLLKSSPYTSTKEYYDLALEAVVANPGDANAKAFALELGRWHYSRTRKDKKPTIYDEQAIQNDILVRVKN
jgi:hypothetical protein